MANTRTPSPTSLGMSSSRTPPPSGVSQSQNRSPNYRSSTKNSQSDSAMPSLRPNIPSMLPKSAQGPMGMQPQPPAHRPINAAPQTTFEDLLPPAQRAAIMGKSGSGANSRKMTSQGQERSGSSGGSATGGRDPASSQRKTNSKEDLRNRIVS